MAVNKYSNPYIPQPYQSTYVSDYIPLPIDLISRSADILHEKESRAIEQLDAVEAAMANASRHVSDIDRPQFASIGEQYRKRIEALPEDGLYFNKVRQIKSLAREFADIETPFLQNAQAIKAARDAILENETFSSTDKQKRIQALFGDYQGLNIDPTGRIDSSSMFKGRSFANRVNIADIADKAVSGIKAMGGDSISIDAEGRLITRGGEVVSPERVQAIAASAIYNSPEAMNFINDEIELALKENPNADPQEIKDKLVNTAIGQAITKHAYSKSNISIQRDPALVGQDGKKKGPNLAMVRSGKSMDTSVASVSDYDKRIKQAIEAGNEPLAKHLETDKRFAVDEFKESPTFGGIAATMFEKKRASELTEKEKEEAFDKWQRFNELKGSLSRDAGSREVPTLTGSQMFAGARTAKSAGNISSVQAKLKDEFKNDYDKLVKLETQFSNFLNSGRTTTDFIITPGSVDDIEDYQNLFKKVSEPREYEVIGNDKESRELQKNLGKHFKTMVPIGTTIGDPFKQENYIDVKYEDDEGNVKSARLKYVAPPREGDLLDISLMQVGTQESEALRAERLNFGRTLWTDEYQPIRENSDIQIAVNQNKGLRRSTVKIQDNELTGSLIWNSSKERAAEDQIARFAENLYQTSVFYNIKLSDIDIKKGLKGQLVGEKKRDFDKLMSKPLTFERNTDAVITARDFKAAR